MRFELSFDPLFCGLSICPFMSMSSRLYIDAGINANRNWSQLISVGFSASKSFRSEISAMVCTNLAVGVMHYGRMQSEFAINRRFTGKQSLETKCYTYSLCSVFRRKPTLCTDGNTLIVESPSPICIMYSISYYYWLKVPIKDSRNAYTWIFNLNIYYTLNNAYLIVCTHKEYSC